VISLGSRGLPVAVDDLDLWAGAIADKAGGVVDRLCSFFCFGGEPSKQGGVSLA